MPQPQIASLPEDAFLQHYRRQGVYTDCYALDFLPGTTFAQYLEAFYTGRLFKLERSMLNWLFGCQSDDLLAGRLARGEVDVFSIWMVEMRGNDQILLCDRFQRTRSWLMCRPLPHPADGTRLYFGSAVTPKYYSADGSPVYSAWFHALHGFHHAYSRGLLCSAHRRLSRQNQH